MVTNPEPEGPWPSWTLCRASSVHIDSEKIRKTICRCCRDGEHPRTRCRRHRAGHRESDSPLRTRARRWPHRDDPLHRSQRAGLQSEHAQGSLPSSLSSLKWIAHIPFLVFSSPITWNLGVWLWERGRPSGRPRSMVSPAVSQGRMSSKGMVGLWVWSKRQRYFLKLRSSPVLRMFRSSTMESASRKP